VSRVLTSLVGQLTVVAVDRRPNMGLPLRLRQHLLRNRQWTRKAKCGEHQDLPWHPDSQPHPLVLLDMATICEECPVIKDCARYALADDGAAGVYAGVWIPWPSSSANVREIRTMARRRLKRIAGINNLRELATI
jgi:Transcription factor WhiB